MFATLPVVTCSLGLRESIMSACTKLQYWPSSHRNIDAFDICTELFRDTTLGDEQRIHGLVKLSRLKIGRK